MSYPINQALTYTALATTTGAPLDTFTYAWAFDDTTTANTATYAKTWATPGNHVATITATDTTTLGVATASKTITVKDWSTFTWTSSGVKITPDASSGFGSSLGAQQMSLIVSGNLIINVFDYQTPQTIVVFNTTTLTKTEYPSLLGTVGTPVAAFLLDSGPNSGSVLILGGGGQAGFFAPSTGIFTLSPNSTPAYPPQLVSSLGAPSTKMGNGKWLVLGTNNITGTSGLIYDPVLDAWSSASVTGACPYCDTMFTLPSGNVFAFESNSTATYLYNYTTNTWSSGPTCPTNFPGGSNPISKLNDGRLILVTGGSSSVQATWTEGAGSFVNDTELYPWASQNGSATGNYHQTLLVTQDNMVINVGGQCTGTLIQDDSVTVFHMPDGSWITGASLLTPGIVYKKCFAAGRAWRSNSGILEYSSVW